MAYTDTSIKTLYYKNQLIGRVWDTHQSFAWIVGKFNYDEADDNIKAFLNEYFPLVDLFGDDPQLWEAGNRRLSEKYNPEFLNEENWYVITADNHKIDLVLVPFIDSEYHQITLKPQTI